ncbi:MAG: hypothetical protein KZQ86_14400, partial [Candidatus Thiodiazotropha sp. (ex Lucinoma kastoroae)]|nr:hypothetical protein [Candidatus Thiodiazotropha sp. (ex Lucinoma kastoroae)]
VLGNPLIIAWKLACATFEDTDSGIWFAFYWEYKNNSSCPEVVMINHDGTLKECKSLFFCQADEIIPA